MAQRLLVNSSPHYRSGETTRTVMTDVVIALFPALVGAIIFFGFRALAITLISVGACLAFETLYCKIAKKKRVNVSFSITIIGLSP